jgi:hypothetical protein
MFGSWVLFGSNSHSELNFSETVRQDFAKPSTRLKSGAGLGEVLTD